MSVRLACCFVVPLAAGVATAQAPRPDPQRLQAMVHEARPAGVDVLNLASIHGELRLLGTAETLGAIQTLIRRMRASGLVGEPTIDAVQSPREGPHVFAISAPDRSIAASAVPTGRDIGDE